MNKTLLGLALGVISLSPLAFASADSVVIGDYQYSSDSVISASDYSFSNDNSYYLLDNSSASASDVKYFCVVNSFLEDISENGVNIDYTNSTNSYTTVPLSDGLIYCDTAYSYSSSMYVRLVGNYGGSFNASGKFLLSDSLITKSDYVPDISTDDDNSSIIPTIPSSFTSGLTSLLSNFGSTIVNWLPTIILLSLGIYVIFALFRVVRNYAKSSFNG